MLELKFECCTYTRTCTYSSIYCLTLPSINLIGEVKCRIMTDRERHLYVRKQDINGILYISMYTRKKTQLNWYIYYNIIIVLYQKWCFAWSCMKRSNETSFLYKTVNRLDPLNIIYRTCLFPPPDSFEMQKLWCIRKMNSAKIKRWKGLMKNINFFSTHQFLGFDETLMSGRVLYNGI